MIRDLLEDPTLAWLWSDLRVRRRYGTPSSSETECLQTVVVLGGGTAGYLSALTMRQAFPNARITVVESPSVPIIGVGEATVPTMLPFLHKRLAINIGDFYRCVQPTWKQGIRFEWGRPAPYHFNAPFDWDSDSVGILGSLAVTHSINAMTFQAMLMEANRVPIVRRADGKYVSLLKHVPIAYHLDNKRFVTYLRSLLQDRGIDRLEATIADVHAATDGSSGIRTLRTEHGAELLADLFIDCSGFHARLLRQALGVEFDSFETSLSTNSAVVFELGHGGPIKPYTTATTMNAGWTWNIPQVESDHCGYVYADDFLTPDAAIDEISAKFGKIDRPRIVKFRTGRARCAWVGNTVAIGNAQGFVEPLESSGLLMITASLELLVDALAGFPNCAAGRTCFNERIATLWDGLRWFLALHYKFNERLDTDFWRHARRDTDVSGADDAIELFRSRSPLKFRRNDLMRQVPLFYTAAGTDTILFGQGVETKTDHDADAAAWRARRDRAANVVQSSITMSEALALEELEEVLMSPRLGGFASDPRRQVRPPELVGGGLDSTPVAD
jgi:tryptophan 7-halogenase